MQRQFPWKSIELRFKVVDPLFRDYSKKIETKTWSCIKYSLKFPSERLYFKQIRKNCFEINQDFSNHSENNDSEIILRGIYLNNCYSKIRT